MGAREWTTEPQKAYLTTKLPAHKLAQETNALGKFWTDLQAGFFKRWPMEERLKLRPLVPGAPLLDKADEDRLGLETAAMKACLKTWCSYHTRRAGRASPKGKKGKGLFKLLKKQAASRPYHEIEVYQSLYRDKIRDARRRRRQSQRGGGEPNVILTEAETLAKELREEEEAIARIRKNCSARMSKLRNTTIAMYAAETTEVKLEVKAEVEQRNLDREGDNAADGVRTPEQYQFAIDQLPTVLKNVSEAIELEAGWIGTLLVGGPMPHRAGAVSTKTFCFGATPEGIDFGAAYPGFASLKSNFFSFLKRCFPHEVRDARGMETEPDAPELPTEDLISMDPEETPAALAAVTKKKPARMRHKKVKTAEVSASMPQVSSPIDPPSPMPAGAVPSPAPGEAAAVAPAPQAPVPAPTPAAQSHLLKQRSLAFLLFLLHLPHLLLRAMTTTSCSQATSTRRWLIWPPPSIAGLAAHLALHGGFSLKRDLGSFGGSVGGARGFGDSGHLLGSSAGQFAMDQAWGAGLEGTGVTSRPDGLSFGGITTVVKPTSFSSSASPPHVPFPGPSGLFRAFSATGPSNRPPAATSTTAGPTSADKSTPPINNSNAISALTTASPTSADKTTPPINNSNVISALSFPVAPSVAANTITSFSAAITNGGNGAKAPKQQGPGGEFRGEAPPMQSRPMGNAPPVRSAARGGGRGGGGRGAKGAKGGRARKGAQMGAVDGTASADAVAGSGDAEMPASFGPQEEGSVAPLTGEAARMESNRIRREAAQLRKEQAEVMKRAIAMEARASASGSGSGGPAEGGRPKRTIKPTRNLDGSRVVHPLTTRGELRGGTALGPQGDAGGVDPNAAREAEDATMLANLRSKKRKADADVPVPAGKVAKKRK
ncbi:hypothetical protein K438DRAFT_1981656 [Mycena galopus ATCC 62051]|nr:hypothetical protein K438DRAFT_1981656 [Mycena galopus ATCC 62051]